MSSFEVKYPSTMMIGRLDINTDLVKEQQIPADLTEEETRLLDTKYSYDNDPYHQLKNPICFTDIALERVWNKHDYALVVICEAYFNLRKEETDDILQVFRDKDARYPLFHFAGSLRRMKEYSVRLREISDSLMQKIPSAATVDLSKQSMRHTRHSTKTKRQKKCGGSKELSKNNYHILVILKEILSILQANDKSEVYEGHKRFVNDSFVNIPSAELLGLVETGMRKLRTEMKRERSSCVKLIRFVCGTFAPTTEEYKVGMSCDEQRDKLSEDLSYQLSLSVCWFGNTDEAIKVAFQDLIDMVTSVRNILWVS